MKWKRIDPDNLPEGEVLAACFEENYMFFQSKMIGRLEKYMWRVDCFENDNVLPNVTHYIDIHDQDNDPKYITNKI